MKSAVSRCTRECAEAQGKDVGMIATENGYNLYVGGNGGTSPVHAQLLAADIDEDTVFKYLDRYIMYDMLTADRLERTAVWQQKLPSAKNGGGPIEHLKEVIIKDSFGICDELDRRIQYLVNAHHDEWTEVNKNPELRKRTKTLPNKTCWNLSSCVDNNDRPIGPMMDNLKPTGRHHPFIFSPCHIRVFKST
jgi:nitrite reductase (NADH) large subunit